MFRIKLFLLIYVKCFYKMNKLSVLDASLSQVYVILRALDGFTMEGFVMISYVLLMECINENKRQTFATQFRSLQVR